MTARARPPPARPARPDRPDRARRARRLDRRPRVRQPRLTPRGNRPPRPAHRVDHDRRPDFRVAVCEKTPLGGWRRSAEEEAGKREAGGWASRAMPTTRASATLRDGPSAWASHGARSDAIHRIRCGPPAAGPRALNDRHKYDWMAGASLPQPRAHWTGMSPAHETKRSTPENFARQTTRRFRRNPAAAEGSRPSEQRQRRARWRAEAGGRRLNHGQGSARGLHPDMVERRSRTAACSCQDWRQKTRASECHHAARFGRLAS